MRGNTNLFHVGRLDADTEGLILLTNDEDVVAWARLEALTGVLSLIGPGAGTSRAPSAGQDHAAGSVGA